MHKPMEIPALNNAVYKLHERLVRPVIEAVAKATCSEAVGEKRELTLTHFDELKELL